MARWHNLYLDNHAHFCTATLADWRPLLTNETNVIIYQQWERARQSYNTKVLAYIMMPEHFHIILWAEHGNIIKTFLSRSLGETSKQLQEGGGFWKERSRVLPVNSQHIFDVKLDYIHRNPLRRNLVNNPEEWVHSSYRQLVLGQTNVLFKCDSWNYI